MPLTLKRSLSQACDPHMAYITVELGSFEDTVGRIDVNLNAPKGSRSNSFAYRVAAKIPVDKVGIYSYQLDWTEKQFRPAPDEEQSIGWVIVRIALEAGIKRVTVESPLVLRNVCNTDLLCEGMFLSKCCCNEV